VAHFFPCDPSRGSRPVAVHLDTFFAFHHANAYEDPDTGAVVFDTVRPTPATPINAHLAFSASFASPPSSRRCVLLHSLLPSFLALINLDPGKAGGNRSSWRYGLGERLATRHPHALHHRRRHQPFSKRPLSLRQIEFPSFPSVVAAVRGRKHRYIYGSPGAKAQDVSLPNRACSRWTPRPRRARKSGCCSRTTSAGSPSFSGATAGLLRTTATC